MVSRYQHYDAVFVAYLAQFATPDLVLSTNDAVTALSDEDRTAKRHGDTQASRLSTTTDFSDENIALLVQLRLAGGSPRCYATSMGAGVT